TARIENEARFDFVFASRILCTHARSRPSALGRSDVHCGHSHFVADLDALLRGLVGEQLVERGALHLERRIPARRELVREVELAVVGAANESRAVLVLKTGGLHRFHHAGLGDEIQAVGQQALADREARELLRLEYQHVPAATLEQRRGDRARRSGADHDDIALLRHSRCGSLPAAAPRWYAATSSTTARAGAPAFPPTTADAGRPRARCRRTRGNAKHRRADTRRASAASAWARRASAAAPGSQCRIPCAARAVGCPAARASARADKRGNRTSSRRRRTTAFRARPSRD